MPIESTNYNSLNTREDIHRHLMSETRFAHEHALATRALVTSMKQNSLDQKDITRDLVGGNEVTTKIIDSQIRRYKSEYDDLPNKMRHYG